MSLKQSLGEDMKSAMKSKDQVALSTIRMLTAAIKNKEIEVGRELDDAGVEELVARSIKQRRESAEQYRNADREELAANEEAEIEVLLKYLPEQLDENAIRELVKEAVDKSGAASMKDMGKVMGVLMPKVKGKADGSVVNRIVKETLGG